MSRRTAGICLVGFALLLYAVNAILPERPRQAGAIWSPRVEPALIVIVGVVGLGYLVAAEVGRRRPPNAP